MLIEIVEWVRPNGRKNYWGVEISDEIGERMQRENINLEFERVSDNTVVYYLTRPNKEDRIIILNEPLNEEILNAEIDTMLENEP